MFGKLASSTSAEHLALRSAGDNGSAEGESHTASLLYLPDYLIAEQQRQLWIELMAIDTWEQESLMMHGKPVPVPRLICYVGDDGTEYAYSGVRHRPKPWSPALGELRHRLCDELGHGFNSVLLNQYRDGRDHMGWHSDDESELGEQPIIASVSLGAERRMRFRPGDRTRSILGSSAKSLHITLEAGSLLVMGSTVQSVWQHCLVRTAQACGPRVNMTFRRVSAV